jgi:hypothetical protein
MNNTRQIIKLDLSGLQTETSVNQYQSFPTPKLNELLYNEYPIHSGGSFASLISNVGKNVGNMAIEQGKNAVKNVASTAIAQGKNIGSSVLKKGKLMAKGAINDISNSTTSDFSPSEQAYPKQSFSSNQKPSRREQSFSSNKKPSRREQSFSSNQISPQEIPQRKQSSSNQRPPQETPQRKQSSSNQRPPQDTSYYEQNNSATSEQDESYSATSEDALNNTNTFNVNTLKIELKEVRKQKESLNARENEIINRIIDSKY